MANDNATNSDSSKQWAALLESQLAKVKSKEDKAREWTFDMDDRPELQLLQAPQLERIKRALEFLQTELYPKWAEADQQAIANQRRHRRITRMAIGCGVAAVAAAIVSLVISHLVPGLMLVIFGIEFISVIAALVAVIAGIWLKTHHEWLTKRQIAERLRSLRFQSVTWPELWCDEPGWQARTRAAIAELVGLTDKQAEKWAKEEDKTSPADVVKPSCAVPAEELKALTAWYRVKRLEFQQHYFDSRAEDTHKQSWGHHWKVSLKLFVASVILVLCHGFVAIFLVDGHHGKPHHPPANVQQAEDQLLQDAGHQKHDADHAGGGADFWHGVEIVLIGLAALLPVIGFGIRAWTSAFESPRSHNLFRAKSLALREPIQRLRSGAEGPINYEDAMWAIVENEHFFVGEHHEWCRLQVEAEWYF